MSGLNLEKHFSLTSSKLIQQICNPVLSNQVRKEFIENTKINRYFILN